MTEAQHRGILDRPLFDKLTPLVKKIIHLMPGGEFKFKNGIVQVPEVDMQPPAKAYMRLCKLGAENATQCSNLYAGLEEALFMLRGQQ